MITRRLFTASAAATSLGSVVPAFAQARTLTYVGWSQDEAASKPTLAAMFDSYRKTNADVKLDVVGFPWAQMQQNILLRLRSGQPLDVVQLAERWLPQFGTTGKMLDMRDVFGKAQLEKLINPGTLTLGEFRGKQLGVPWTSGSIGMVANAKVLKDAGVSAPPQTIDAFVEALKAIKKSQPQSVPYAMTTKNNNSLSPDFQVWLWTFGGKLFDDKGKVTVNSAAGVRALTFMSELVQDGLAAKDIDRPTRAACTARTRPAFTTMPRWHAALHAVTPARAMTSTSSCCPCLRLWCALATRHSRSRGGICCPCSRMARPHRIRRHRAAS